jgi:hypothetical protein
VRFDALLKGFDRSFLDRGRCNGARLWLAHALFSDRRFAIQHGHRGALAPRSFFHRGFASQVPTHE